MKNFITRWLINAVGIIFTAKIVPGIHLAGSMTAVVAALILGLLNAFIKPFILVITLPINVLSLGIFTFFINAFFFYVSSKFVEGFTISGFRSAFFGALCLSLISVLLNMFTGPLSKVEVRSAGGERKAEKYYPNAIDAEIVEPKDEKNETGKEKKLLS